MSKTRRFVVRTKMRVPVIRRVVRKSTVQQRRVRVTLLHIKRRAV